MEFSHQRRVEEMKMERRTEGSLVFLCLPPSGYCPGKRVDEKGCLEMYGGTGRSCGVCVCYCSTYYKAVRVGGGGGGG